MFWDNFRDIIYIYWEFVQLLPDIPFVAKALAQMRTEDSLKNLRFSSITCCIENLAIMNQILFDGRDLDIMTEYVTNRLS